MRMIRENPRNVIPDITEKDIKDSIIIAVISNKYSFELAYIFYTIIDSQIQLNWYGGHTEDDRDAGYSWFWESNCSLIEFLSICWERWSENSNVLMYVCESTSEVTNVANKYIQNKVFKQKLINKANEVFQ